MSSSNYVEENLPQSIVQKLEAGAFQSLCAHLRDRSVEVQNIDLMTISGFCRNCLAKWMVMEARKLSDKLGNEGGEVLQRLDGMGYDEAAKYVYGMAYPEWKQQHLKKASDAQMQKFNNSNNLWATFDKAVLAKRIQEDEKVHPGDSASTLPPMTTKNYVEEFLPPAIVEKLEAGAFQSLCTHLRERSEEVQNIDLMTVSGFCRNCLAKWMVVEARKLSENLRSSVSEKGLGILERLDGMGYDEAAQYVYGMGYPEWKKRYSKKASDDQMKRFNESKPIWAEHDKALLAKRSGQARANNSQAVDKPTAPVGTPSNSLLSNVCCQDVEEAAKTEPVKKKATSRTRELPPYEPPVPPTISFSLGILTVSDRAAAGKYITGDLSGPAVKEAVTGAVKSYGGYVKLQATEGAVVSDDSEAIQAKLREWADTLNLDFILTTGGTGFAARDVTPEATMEVISRSCEGLVTFVTMECAKMQPLSSLSRGTAGIRGNTLIANLPGNPKGVREIVPILLPLALHAIADIKAETN